MKEQERKILEDVVTGMIHERVKDSERDLLDLIHEMVEEKTDKELLNLIEHK